MLLSVMNTVALSYIHNVTSLPCSVQHLLAHAAKTMRQRVGMNSILCVAVLDQ